MRSGEPPAASSLCREAADLCCVWRTLEFVRVRESPSSLWLNTELTLETFSGNWEEKEADLDRGSFQKLQQTNRNPSEC